MTSPHASVFGRLPLWVRAALLFLGYVVAAELGNRLSVQQTFSTFWPPAGLVLGVLLLTRPRDWPILIAAAFAGNVASDLLHGRELLVTLGFSTANTVEALAGAALARRFLGKRMTFDSPTKVLGFTALAALAATALGATIGSAVVVASSAGQAAYLDVWPTWWLGDVLGVLLVTPVLITWGTRASIDRPGDTHRPGRLMRGASVIAGSAALVVAGWVVVVNGGITAGLKFLLFPPAAMIAWWAGPLGAALSTLGLAISSNLALVSMVPRLGLVEGDIRRNILLLQAFLAAIAFTTQMLAVAMERSRHSAEEARVAAQKYRLLLEELPVGVTITDEMGVVIETSRRAAQILGACDDLQRERGIGGAEWTIVRPDRTLLPASEFASVRALEEGVPVSGQEMGVVKDDGTITWVSVSAAPIPVPGYGVAVIYGDVTSEVEAREDLRRSEAELSMARDNLEEEVARRTLELEWANRDLLEANETKSRFLANVSHELRTPLNSVIGFTGVMLQGLTGPISEEQRGQLAMVKRSGQRLLALVNDLLDLTRVDAGKDALEVSEFTSAELLEQVVEMVGPSASAKRLAFDVECGAEPITMRSDQRKLQQVLLNLLVNAVKFTASGTVALSCEQVGERVIFRVSDTGIGIPEEELLSIMDEFHQVDRADGMKPEGTGLGLAISCRLALLLGGTLSAESALGEGSVFTLDVPMVITPRDAAS
ncbi:MAG: MASE1 domain-containing protein [Coriobacteriia bacterium]|nr:MASE1 domain-containing protein [Coriobacteriia bacterium]